MAHFCPCNSMRGKCFQILKKQLKSEPGTGWVVRAMCGKVPLNFRLDESAGIIIINRSFAKQII